MIILRDYQKDLIESTRESLRTHKKILVELPCRAGKTVMFAYMAMNHVKKGGYVWFLVHRKELVDQAINTFEKMDIPMNNITIGMVQTVSRHLDKYPKPSLIIFDEAHHSSANTWEKIIDKFPQTPIIGLTATPCRSDNKCLGNIYDDLVIGVSAKWLIDEGYINQYDYYAPDINLESAKWTMKGSDYDMQSVERSLDKPEIYGSAMKYVDPSKRTIIYCPTVAYSERLAEEINQKYKGIAVHVDGELSKEERDYRINSFRQGTSKVLTNCFLVGEGLDVPECDTVIMLRPTMSVGLYIQQSMRCLTKYEGKRAVIYDLVGNVFRHGLPTDDREWSLSKPIKIRNKSGEKDLIVRECKNCLRVYKGSNRICPYCGHDNGMTQKEIKEHHDIEVKQIKELEKKQERREQGRAQTYEALVALGVKRGYKNPSGWAYRIMMSRKRI